MDGAFVHPGSGLGPLLPELAQLEWLEELFLEHSEGQPWGLECPWSGVSLAPFLASSSE